MRRLSDGELARMDSARAETMMDECFILRRSDGTPDAHGRPRDIWTEIGPYDCGFVVQMNTDREELGDAQVPTFHAQFRLRTGVTITNLDRMKLTKRYGEELTMPPIYQVISTSNNGPSGVTVIAREL